MENISTWIALKCLDSSVSFKLFFSNKKYNILILCEITLQCLRGFIKIKSNIYLTEALLFRTTDLLLKVRKLG